MRRVLIVGRSRYQLPLSESLAKKFGALSERLEVRVLATGTGSDPRFNLHRPLRALDGFAFFALLPMRVARELREFRPDVVLAQSPYETAAALVGRRLGRAMTPIVVELHGDPATFARLYGSPLRRLLAPTLDRVAAWTLRRADAVRALSPFTIDIARQQGVEPTAVFTTFTDLAAFSDPPVEPLPERPTALFVGVLERYKNVDGIAAAWRLAAPRVPGARLVLVGEGRMPEPFAQLVADLPEQTEWIRELPTPAVVKALDDAWTLLLPSRSEGLPRVVLEAFCRGRAVIGGRAGGIPDVVRDGQNGFLVHPDDHGGIAEAIVRILSDRRLAERLGAQARKDAEPWQYTADEYADSVVELVERVADRKPRLFFVGRTRFSFPLNSTLLRRYDALSEVVEWRQLGSGRSADERFALAPRFPVEPLDGIAFYATFPFRVARELARFRPDVVLVQGAQETALVLLARALARVPAKVVLDVHGDWRAPTRLYGSRLRRVLDPIADVLASIGLRRADGVRTVSSYTTSLVRARGREPAAVFPAYMNLEPFCADGPVPLPEVPTALFVGVLERYKAVDVLAEAWRDVAARLPGARLHVVGSGRLHAPTGAGVSWTPSLSTEGVAAALDEATLLVLPSRSEGMGRVIVEAFCRGRAVIGSRVGGIPDLVEDGVNGILVEPDDPRALADALVRLLGDEALAARMGAAAREGAEPWIATPEEFADRIRALVETVAGQHT